MHGNGEERKKEVKRNAKAWAVFGEAGCADMREGARVPLFAPRGEPRQGRTTARQNTPQNTAGRRAIKKNVARNARRIKSRRARERQRFSSAESAAKNGKKISRRRIASASGEAIRARAKEPKKRQGNEKKKHRAKRNSARPVFFRCPKKSGKALKFNVAVMNTEIIISFTARFVF